MRSEALDWEWTRTEFRKALIDCVNAANGVCACEMQDLLSELHACSLLVLNFRSRLSVKHQRTISDLAAVSDFPHCELGFDDPAWNESFTRRYFEDVSRRARRSIPVLEAV